MKIAELDDRLKKLKDNSIVLDLQQQSIERKIAGYEVLLEKLNNIEKFTTETYSILFENNKRVLDDFSKVVLSDLNHIVDEKLDRRMEDIEKYLSELKKMEVPLNQYQQTFYNLAVEIHKVGWFGAILSQHLVKKNIMTDKERRDLFVIAERNRQKDIKEFSKNKR